MELENSMNTNFEPAIAENSEPPQVSEEGATVGTEPQDQPETLENTATSEADGQQVADEEKQANEALPFLEVKYNKEKRSLTQEEAKNFAEIGLKYQDIRERLERYATLKGTTVAELVDNLEASEDEAYRKKLEEKFGDDAETINKMMEFHQIEKQRTLDNAQKNKADMQAKEEQNENQRIADEFTSMKKDFPELTEFSALPEPVKKAALEGKSLAYAYLLHKYKEENEIKKAEKNQIEAENTSVGSVDSAESVDFVGDAFTKGLFGN